MLMQQQTVTNPALSMICVSLAGQPYFSLFPVMHARSGWVPDDNSYTYNPACAAREARAVYPFFFLFFFFF